MNVGKRTAVKRRSKFFITKAIENYHINKNLGGFPLSIRNKMERLLKRKTAETIENHFHNQIYLHFCKPESV